MIGYAMVGARDLKRAIEFYDPLFKEMGVSKAWRDDQAAAWGAHTTVIRPPIP